MRSVPPQVWPIAGAVGAVIAVVVAALALATPGGGPTAAPTLGPVATSTPTRSTAPDTPATDEVATAVPTLAVEPAAVDPAAEVVPVADFAELPAVELAARADYGNGVTGSVVDIEAVQAEAHGIGEIAGPAVVVTVELRAGREQIDLGDVVVNLYGPSGAAAPTAAGDPHHRPFEGSLRAGESARAAYVLRPAEPDAVARITVAYSGAVPAVTFEGPLP